MLRSERRFGRPQTEGIFDSQENEERTRRLCVQFQYTQRKAPRSGPPNFIDHLKKNPEITSKRPDLEVALKAFIGKRRRHKSLVLVPQSGAYLRILNLINADIS